MTFVKVHETGTVNTQSKVKCRNVIMIMYVTHVPLLFNQETFLSLSLRQFIPYNTPTRTPLLITIVINLKKMMKLSLLNISAYYI